MASTAPAVKAAILNLLQGTAALEQATITWAAPTKDEDFAGGVVSPGNEFGAQLIFLDSSGDGAAVESEDDWASLGAQSRRETYRVALTVWVEQWGDDPQPVEERAWELWGLLANALRDDLRTPGSDLRAAGLQQFNRMTARLVNGPASPEKWGSRIDGTVRCVALNRVA